MDRRYWIEAGVPEISVEEQDIEEQVIELNKRMRDIGFGFRGEQDMPLLKTTDKKEAQEMIKEAIEVFKASGLEKEWPTDAVIKITIQPQCPYCGLGRFADFYCSNCGTEMMRGDFVDIYEFVEE